MTITETFIFAKPYNAISQNKFLLSFNNKKVLVDYSKYTEDLAHILQVLLVLNL